jgi:hypothetical protein
MTLIRVVRLACEKGKSKLPVYVLIDGLSEIV